MDGAERKENRLYISMSVSGSKSVRLGSFGVHVFHLHAHFIHSV